MNARLPRPLPTTLPASPVGVSLHVMVDATQSGYSASELESELETGPAEGGRHLTFFGPLCLLLLSLLPSVRKNIANKPRTHTHAHSPRYLLRPSLAYSESLAARLHWRARAVSKHSEKFSLTKRSKAKWRIWQRQS